MKTMRPADDEHELNLANRIFETFDSPSPHACTLDIVHHIMWNLEIMTEIGRPHQPLCIPEHSRGQNLEDNLEVRPHVRSPPETLFR